MGREVRWRVGREVELWIRVGSITRMEWEFGECARWMWGGEWNCGFELDHSLAWSGEWEFGEGAGMKSGSDGALGVWEFDLGFNSICGR